MESTSLLHNTTPLCFMPDNSLIYYHRGKVVLLKENKELNVIPVPITKKEWLLGWNLMATRLFRFGARSAIAIDNNHIVINIGNRLHEIDLIARTMTNGWHCGNGIRPLFLSEVTGIKGFNDGIYFGQYWKNDGLNPISIYYRKGVDDWRGVYTFPQGAIKHIHNLIPDPYRQCVWIMTGDFGESAALWKVTDGFNKVEHVVGGDQRWRGCVGFAIPEGLIYATDTPFSNNHIYLFRDNGAVETLYDISGSCIYGCQWKDKYVFASTVEADGRDETLLKLLFGWKRGVGIKDNYVRIYVGDYTNGFKEVYKERKDTLPFIFQFGAFRFPAGKNNYNTLYFQPVATQKNDLRLMALSINE